MPKTITKTVYTFQELLEANKAGTITATAVERARNWLREGATDHDWYEHTQETWATALGQLGFMEAEIAFSGFWSQGDGASFTCKQGVDKNTLIEFLTTDIAPSEQIAGDPEDFRPWVVHKISGKPNVNPQWVDLLAFDLDLSVTRFSSQYSHKRTCRFGADWDGPRQLNGISPEQNTALELLLTSLCDAGELLRLDLCDAIYKDLEEEYEYLTSDKSLIEDSDSNDYTFDANGRRDG